GPLFTVPPKELPLQRSHDASRVPRHQHAGRHIFGDHCACAHHAIAPHSHSGKYDRPATDPDVVIDMNGCTRLPSVSAGGGVKGMGRRQQLYVRTDTNLLANSDGRHIECDQAKVYKSIGPDMYVLSIVHI